MPEFVKNNFGKFLLILVLQMVLIAGFLFLKNSSVRAEEQIKIIPESYSGIWQNPEAVFSQDLGPTAVLADFNHVNSSYPLEALEILTEEQILPPATSTEETATSTSSEQATSTEKIATSTEEIIAPTSTSTNSTTTNATTTVKIKTPSFFTRLWAKIKNLFNSEAQAESLTCQHGANRPCGIEIGQCQIGIQVCENGVWEDCLGSVEPALEICDGVDNDCDGEVDEEVCLPEICQHGSNRPCGTEIGACQIGVQVCENGVWGKCFGSVEPSPEICDEIDNDCDEEVDEGGVCGGVPLPATPQIKKALIISDFNISPTSDTKIKFVQLRLSLAGRGEADDKLVIDYFYQDVWQNVAIFNLENEISNALNGGYFLYALPIFENWNDLENLKIRFTSVGQGQVFLDAVWLEVEYGEEEEIIEEEEEPGPEFAEGHSLELISNKKDFKLSEAPIFKFRYQKERGFFEEIGAGILNLFRDEYKDINIKTTVSGFSISPNIRYEGGGEFSVDLTGFEKPRQFRPGKYILNIEIEDPSLDSGQVQNFSQEFIWGVLAINANKSIYLPNETAYLQMAVLNDNGHTICDANLKLEVINSDGGRTSINVERSGKCGPDNVTDVPDYFAYYQVGRLGTYQMKLTNLDTGYEITDSFEVKDSVPFEVERVGPTRIYPLATYEMKMTIKANRDFAGEVIETTPAGFMVQSSASGFSLQVSENEQRLVWDVDWKIGESYELAYTFDAPDVSPYLYLLGPLEIDGFKEIRQWQLASDAADINYGYGTGLNNNQTSSGYFYTVYVSADTPETFDGAGIVNTIKIYNNTANGSLRIWKGTFSGETFVFDDYTEIVDIDIASTGWITLTAPTDFTAFAVTANTGLGFYSHSTAASGLLYGGGTGVGNMNYGYNSADPPYSTSLSMTDGTSRRLEIKVEGSFPNASPNTPTIAETPSFSHIVTSTQPVLGGFAATDDDLDDVEFKLVIDDDYDLSSPVLTKYSSDYPTDAGWSAATFSSGATTTYTVQSGDALTGNTTYWWAVVARDPTGSNNWSATSSKQSLTASTTVVSAQWFQTTYEQFNTDTFDGAAASSSDDSVWIPSSASGSETFTDIGADTWQVPAGVTEITIKVWGAGGGGGGGGSFATYGGGGDGGGGGFAHATAISVTPLDTLDIWVGAGGGGGSVVGSGTDGGSGGAGGGYSSVENGSTILIMAGAGGGGGGGDNSGSCDNETTHAGGDGGGGGSDDGASGQDCTGGTPYSDAGTGGNTSGASGGVGGTGGLNAGLDGVASSDTPAATGGNGGNGGTAGAGNGGDANSGDVTGGDGGLGNSAAYGAGGGGGGGRYGGGGGSSAVASQSGGSGGGGGSSLVTGTPQSNTQGTTGGIGAGQGDSDYPGGVGDGGAGGGVSAVGNDGEDGAIVIIYDAPGLDYGTITSTEIDFDWVPGQTEWGEVIWSTTETQGDVKLYVMYTVSSACDTTITDAVLSGNETGFDVSSSPLNISGLNTTTYNRICLKAKLTKGVTVSPTLDDWRLTWEPPTGNNAPETISCSIDSGAASIDLTAGTTKNVVCAGTVQDLDGFEEITSVEAEFYRTSIEQGASDDKNNHYTLTGDSECIPSNGSGTTEDYACTFSVYYFADGTDGSSAYSADNWTCWMMPSDAEGEGTALTDTIEMNTLLSLEIDESEIVFNNGNSMDTGTDTGSENSTSTIINTGNVRMDIKFDGYGTEDGDGRALSCSSGFIAVDQEKYGPATTTFSSLPYTLSDTATEQNWDVLQRTDDDNQVLYEDKKYCFWGLNVPADCDCGGTCSGHTVFTAVNDAAGD